MTAAQPYIAISRRPLDLEDYFSVARRHSGWIAGPAFAGLVISFVIAFSLPNVYEAKAVMQITPSQISESLVQTTVNQQLTERILQMESNITSRQSLATMINDPHLNLYKEERAKEPLEDVEDEMREAIHITINPEMVSRKGASQFSISFQYRTRQGARDTVNTLITRFIQESTTTQHDQQTTISEFFGDELAQAKANLDKQAEALTNFRKTNEGRLPEQESSNIATLGSLERQVDNLTSEINRLANDRFQIEGRINSTEATMKLLSTINDDADSMPLPTSAAARQNEELIAVNRTLENQKQQLEQMKQVFKPDWPDMVNIQKSIKVNEARRDKLLADQEKQQAEEAAKPKPVAKKPTNYKAMESQQQYENQMAALKLALTTNDRDRDFRIQQREKLNKEIEDYRTRLKETSALMAPYADLERDYKAAAEKYEKFQKQKDITVQNGELISRRATEYMDTLDAPTTPQKPVSPKRTLIIGAGFGVSLLLGFALAGVQEARDTSLKNLKDVRAYTNLPVLCSIPLLENTLLVKRKRRITALAWSAAVIIGILAVSGSLFYYTSFIANT